jgi:hypothetical protein
MTAPAEFQTEIPIVLTGTIIPNQIVGAASDPEMRAAEYLAALAFYQQFAPVIFLENSGYALERHAGFRETARLQVRRFAPSTQPERGKGYQEFEMLDAWLAAGPQPPARWLKITGRYRMQNIRDLLRECAARPDCELIIDQVRRARAVRTYLFCVNTAFYRKQIAGAYLECDDRNGDWIERVLFRKLKTAAGAVGLFATQPRLAAIDGSSGTAFPSGRGQWLGKQILRNCNRLVDRKYLWYSK